SWHRSLTCDRRDVKDNRSASAETTGLETCATSPGPPSKPLVLTGGAKLIESRFCTGPARIVRAHPNDNRISQGLRTDGDHQGTESFQIQGHEGPHLNAKDAQSRRQTLLLLRQHPHR